jgi:hypothetical protein
MGAKKMFVCNSLVKYLFLLVLLVRQIFLLVKKSITLLTCYINNYYYFIMNVILDNEEFLVLFCSRESTAQINSMQM